MAFMLERHDHAKPILRSVARELLSSCVLRSLMSFFNPYTANKVCPRTSHAPSRSDLRRSLLDCLAIIERRFALSWEGVVFISFHLALAA